MTETSAYVLLKNDFINKVIEITMLNINDQMLCQSTSSIIYIAFKSDRFISEHSLFSSGVGRFRLALALLTTYKSNDPICLNTLYVLNRLLNNSKIWRVQEEDLNILFNSNIFETIDFIVKNTKNESVLYKCSELLDIMSDKSKVIDIYH